MPLSLSTIARSGRIFKISLYLAIILSFMLRFSILAKRSFKPLLAPTPASLSSLPNSAKISLKKIFTKCPNITGSLTFIIVAFKCTEYKRSSFLASSMVFSIKSSSALTLINVALKISPLFNLMPLFSNVFCPFSLSKLILNSLASLAIKDFSLL